MVLSLFLFLYLLLITLSVNCNVGEHSDILGDLALVTGPQPGGDRGKRPSEILAHVGNDHTTTNSANAMTSGIRDTPDLDLRLGLPTPERLAHAKPKITPLSWERLPIPPDAKASNILSASNHAPCPRQDPRIPPGSNIHRFINVLPSQLRVRGIFPFPPLTTLSAEGARYMSPTGVAVLPYGIHVPRFARPQLSRFDRIKVALQALGNPSMAAQFWALAQSRSHPNPTAAPLLAGPSFFARKENGISLSPTTGSSTASPSESRSSVQSTSNQLPLRQRNSIVLSEVKKEPVLEVSEGKNPNAPLEVKNVRNFAIYSPQSGKKPDITSVEGNPQASLKIEKDTTMTPGPAPKQGNYLDSVNNGKNPIDREAEVPMSSTSPHTTVGISNQSKLNLAARRLQRIKKDTMARGTLEPLIVSKNENNDWIENSPIYKAIRSGDLNFLSAEGNSGPKRGPEELAPTPSQPSKRKMLGIQSHNVEEAPGRKEIGADTPNGETSQIPKPWHQTVTEQEVNDKIKNWLGNSEKPQETIDWLQKWQKNNVQTKESNDPNANQGVVSSDPAESSKDRSEKA